MRVSPIANDEILLTLLILSKKPSVDSLPLFTAQKLDFS